MTYSNPTVGFRNISTALTLAIASALTASQVQAQSTNGNVQDQSAQAQQPQEQIQPISEWNYDEVYQKGRFLASGLMGTDAIGQNGDDIGDITNAVLNEQDKIIAIIAEVGGFWDIGDTHVIVPWEQVQLSEQGVQIPVNEDNIEQYQLYGEDSVVKKQAFQQKAAIAEGAETGQRTWKLSELINDYSNLQSGAGYGYVDNAVFSKDGKLLAVLVMSSGNYGPGTMAYPFYGYSYGWQPGFSSYQLPYSEQDVSEMTAFDFEQFNGLWES
ncbi:PRC-barrel domain-containing protein [Halomonas sp. McH1-25]|uniref:PRC-barrel domain-containing protein n=1 Tax=unclassified Halomonas TaxID=2609666 RepID=UPI001EF6C8BA|nr:MULTISPECIES: PRC-barrel domain-containing protein [unclassified Halomonas]MCG7601225.1 PRC-barrel domain-containing protein [Halomonas sp. McH1-25]MCP1341915.1 PRC-barrel domain-containing protein [Halomonas sp. FL8]MCP1360180.1 PRC-barrel domain-containing protein [Halomonas sp. BBD45]MCP1365682.1 PRC-barrel domain-containing protein [Halomonas sp. BBD48]